MSDIKTALSYDIGGRENRITVAFKKTCNVRPYESETVEATTEIVIDTSLKGYERQFVLAVAQASVELEVYNNLLAKGLISVQEHTERIKALDFLLKDLERQDIQMYGEDALNKLKEYLVEVK